jgi:NADH:ubiquinone oxidoreductase subunit 5 (subunit L)/multisubunit Na+/H+ antiporter MnhA subunit
VSRLVISFSFSNVLNYLECPVLCKRRFILFARASLVRFCNNASHKGVAENDICIEHELDLIIMPIEIERICCTLFRLVLFVILLVQNYSRFDLPGPFKNQSYTSYVSLLLTVYLIMLICCSMRYLLCVYL